MHGGSASAQSEGEGRGSTFVVSLPASSAAAPREPASQLRQLPSFEESDERVLIVDDNEDAAELLSDVLTTLGRHTLVARDGPEALRLARSFKPTVALLDIGLPVMDGYELARRLRSELNLPDLWLVAITGYGQSEDRRRSEEAGFDVHLVKPVELDVLVEALRKQA